jgi:acetyl esterase/lipase
MQFKWIAASRRLWSACRRAEVLTMARAASVTLAGLVVAATPAYAQRGGTLISADPVAGAPPGTHAWKIRYWSTDDRARPMAVTGMVIAPRDTSRTPRKVIAWAHGTSGVVESCALSTNPRFFDATPAMPAVSRGYVIVAPDYPGLGSSVAHPYLVGTVTGRSVLDAVKAARQIAAVHAGNRFAVWGESQGGHAALWTGQLAKDDAPGLKLVGVAAAAPPTELADNFRQVTDANVKAMFTAYTVYTWSRYYGVPLQIGRKTTPGLITRLAQRCINLDATPKLGTVLGILALRRDLKGVDLASTPPWSSHVAANSTSPISSVPILIAQTRADPLVASAVTRRFARKLCANRVPVRWIDLPGKDHPTTAKQSATATLDWIDGRFAGAQVPNDCGHL